MSELDTAKTERALRRSELRYRRLFESAKDGILILSPDTACIVDVNPFMTELTGYPREFFMGEPVWEICLPQYADDMKAKLVELQLRDYAQHDCLPLKTIDGREVEVELVSNAYLADDARVIQCNVRDITVRKRAEAALLLRDRAIQAVSQGILITDPLRSDNPIVYVSPGFTRLTGYQSNEASGRNCRFLSGPDTDLSAIEQLRDAIREQRGCDLELLNYRKDGTSFWNHLVVTPCSTIMAS